MRKDHAGQALRWGQQRAFAQQLAARVLGAMALTSAAVPLVHSPCTRGGEGAATGAEPVQTALDAATAAQAEAAREGGGGGGESGGGRGAGRG